MVSNGLEGIVVAETRLSHVDGEAGRLIIAGQDVEALTGRRTFEQVCSLLWSGSVDDANTLKAKFARGRAHAFELLPRLGDALEQLDGMAALRTALSHLRRGDDGVEAAALIVGATGAFAAAWLRTRMGLPLISPDSSAGHAADVLRMATGKSDEARAKALDSYLVTVSDHGMNASTFTARVIISTGSDLVSAIVGAAGALKGPLHGGAPGPVLDMLDAIAAPENAGRWLEGELAAGRRIMGMGHRIYRVRDPRAAVLERAVETLEKSGVSNSRLSLARAVEKAAVGVLKQKYPDRALAANVEFYTAVLLDLVGLHRDAFSPMFATGRVAGWLAHAFEQRKTGRLIRPASNYIGAMPNA